MQISYLFSSFTIVAAVTALALPAPQQNAPLLTTNSPLFISANVNLPSSRFLPTASIISDITRTEGLIRDVQSALDNGNVAQSSIQQFKAVVARLTNRLADFKAELAKRTGQVQGQGQGQCAVVQGQLTQYSDLETKIGALDANSVIGFNNFLVETLSGTLTTSANLVSDLGRGLGCPVKKGNTCNLFQEVERDLKAEQTRVSTTLDRTNNLNNVGGNTMEEKVKEDQFVRKESALDAVQQATIVFGQLKQALAC